MRQPPTRVSVLRIAVLLAALFEMFALVVLVRFTPILFTLFMFFGELLFGVACSSSSELSWPISARSNCCRGVPIDPRQVRDRASRATQLPRNVGPGTQHEASRRDGRQDADRPSCPARLVPVLGWVSVSEYDPDCPKCQKRKTIAKSKDRQQSFL